MYKGTFQQNRCATAANVLLSMHRPYTHDHSHCGTYFMTTAWLSCEQWPWKVSGSLKDRISLFFEGPKPLQPILCGYDLHTQQQHGATQPDHLTYAGEIKCNLAQSSTPCPLLPGRYFCSQHIACGSVESVWDTQTPESSRSAPVHRPSEGPHPFHDLLPPLPSAVL